MKMTVSYIIEFGTENLHEQIGNRIDNKIADVNF